MNVVRNIKFDRDEMRMIKEFQNFKDDFCNAIGENCCNCPFESMCCEIDDALRDFGGGEFEIEG